MKEEPSPSRSLKTLKKWLSISPESRDELLGLVRDSRSFLEADTADMLEGVLELPSLQVREIMTPRPSVIGFLGNESIRDVLPSIIESAHSRFPVFSAHDHETVTGVLIAKDLLKLMETDNYPATISELARTPVFIPETARVDQLLSLLRQSRSHLAVVVDEYGNTAGLVTLEDVLEEIVGNIEDEHDLVSEDEQFVTPDPQNPDQWYIAAQMPIDEFNEHFDSNFEAENAETLGGLMLEKLGRVNDLANQTLVLDDWIFTITGADERRIQQIRAKRKKPASA